MQQISASTSSKTTPPFNNPSSSKKYQAAFTDWMTELQPQMFVTINVPNASKDEKQFVTVRVPNAIRLGNGRTRARLLTNSMSHIRMLTRLVERDILGPRTLKQHDNNARIVWLIRREIVGTLVHYHCAVRVPFNRRWRHGLLPTSPRPEDYREAFRDAIRRAMQRLPEAFVSGPGLPQSICDVRRFDPETHAKYMLKEMHLGDTDPQLVIEKPRTLFHDSGLTILPMWTRENKQCRTHSNANASLDSDAERTSSPSSKQPPSTTTGVCPAGFATVYAPPS